MATAKRPTDAEAIAALATLRAYLAAPDEPAGPAFYTSLNLPPGCRSRAAFHARCKTVAEAYRDGKSWVCPVPAYNAALQRPLRPRPLANAAKRGRQKIDYDRLVAEKFGR